MDIAMITHFIDDLVTKITQSIPSAGDASLVRSLVSSSLQKLDIVSREEFDAQNQVLARTREKLEALEAELESLKNT